MYLKLVHILTIIGCCALTSANNWQYNLYKGLEEYVRTGNESAQLRSAVSGIKFPRLFRTSYTRKEKDLMSDIVCGACNIGVDVVITARKEGTPIETIGDVIEFFCKNVFMEPPHVCSGFLDLNLRTFGYMLDNTKNITSKRVCSIILQDFNCIDPDRVDWTVNIPPRLANSTHVLQKGNSDSYKLLHLTDLHYDPNYEVGSGANCIEPLCCQSGSIALRSEDQAGYWGDYRGCDLPWHSLVDALDHVTSEHQDLDLVYFTGDIIDHKIWKVSVEHNKETIRTVYKKLNETFGNVKVYPVLGNHEPHPVNMFSSHVVEHNHWLSTQWVFEVSAEEWLRWLPKETEETILRGGYYTVLHKPGFRVIALNSNVCYTHNFWLFHEDKDPFGQLQWLVDTLAEAEKNGELVHILSHVSSGDGSSMHNWGNEFAKIMYRFSHIISAEFNGHSHDDDIVILYTQEETPEPINVAFNGGSLTPWSNLNPNYKVYEVDSNTHHVVDYESWSYNLTEANMDPQTRPQWKKLYSFKESYGVTDISPKEVANLVERMTKDPELTQSYFRFKTRDADPFRAIGCDSECELKNICYMVTFTNSNRKQCEMFTEMYNANRNQTLSLFF
ncbi:hypothetical protein PPYR_04006 [Photinus pyralis]|uniref:Sphingomyelin phosphodiesterase n=1 Tax=Photinus pyralis TaxID=7054 RepID=A0A5N4AXD8_PHOPY|nr:sphingomyelin phosphodiesterase 1-like [Photinus pyralis]XP_031341318.1 sphingomyelin phosphodiesterase 1-like [Photinus pyralis]KAB0799318.1 hypothetical protein PPYR_07198 [Photinus pyralis]KAB0801820.1 hypothetical protein PPYR_04006 [Photinus pyralis]